MAGALERARAHDDVAARRRQAVQQHDRRPLARVVDRERTPSRRPCVGHWHGSTLSIVVIDVTEQTFEQRRHRALPDHARSSSTSGPSGAARAASSGPVLEKAAAEREGQVELAKLDTDANPRISAGLRHPGHPRRQGVQGRPASSPSSSAPSRPPQVERFFDGLRAQPRPTRWSTPATRPRCAARSSSSPAAPTPRSPLARLLRDRGERDEALELLEQRRRLVRRRRPRRPHPPRAADDPDLARGVRRARRAASRERGLDALIGRDPARRRRQDDLRRAVVGVLDELGVDHPLAREAPPPARLRAVLAGTRGLFRVARTVIAHLDMDAFYVSVELLRRPELRGKPVIVAGRARARWSPPRPTRRASSASARRCPPARARRLCPRGVFLPPDFAAYRAKSRAVMDARARAPSPSRAGRPRRGLPRPLRRRDAACAHAPRWSPTSTRATGSTPRSGSAPTSSSPRSAPTPRSRAASSC